MKSRRYLTRYTYETTAFQGWRVSITRSGVNFTKYFSDKKFGDSTTSMAAAERALESLLKLLEKAKKKRGKLSSFSVEKAKRHLASF